MARQQYLHEDVHFSCQYKVYLRWHTYRAKPNPALGTLTRQEVSRIVARYEMKLLEFSTNDREILLQIGLQEHETVSTAASKIKGQISKLLRVKMGMGGPATVLGKGYFACTGGKTTKRAVENYLEKQATHHGYDKRVLPPTFSETRELTAGDEVRLSPAHAVSVLQFHVVLSTPMRQGVFGSMSGPMLLAAWQELGGQEKFAVIKSSFVPDHVHLALRIHPSVSPSSMVIGMMNRAEEVMVAKFREHLITAGVDRLWQNSAYIGSYGDITAGNMAGYVQKWARSAT